MITWLRKHADEMGLMGAALVLIVGIVIAAAAILGGPAGYEAVDKDPPKVPVELIDHADERAGLERGYQFGAEPDAPAIRPTGFPGYKFIESPNYSGRGTCPPQAIVIHIAGPGSFAGMDNWFRNPASQVSAHFGIDKDGSLHQYVGVEAAAWHAGIINLPDTNNPLIASWVRSGINPNRCHIGIETMLGGPAEPLVNYPAMQATLEDLLVWLSDNFDIPLDRVHVIGHYQLDAVSRSTDPRCCIDIDSLLSSIAAPAADSLCCGTDYTGDGVADGFYNETQQQWEWKPDDKYIWTVENPFWRCVQGCP